MRKKQRLFLELEGHLINEGMIELEKALFGKHHSIR